MPTLTSAGFERHIKYWRLQELETTISEVEDVFADSVHQKVKLADDLKNILLFTMGKCITTIREITCLVMYGYPDGALSLSRNLYEQFIIIAFLNCHRQDNDFEKIIGDYFINYKIEQYKSLRYEANHCRQDSELVDSYTSKIKKAAELAYHTVSERNEYWWSGKRGFYPIVEDIQNNEADSFNKRELAYLYLFYKRACSSIHANCFGNSVRLGVDSKYNGVDTSPQSEGHGIALYLSAISFLIISEIAFDEFNIDFDNYRNKIHELMIYYKKIVQEEYFSA